ncbi:MAG TPA: hypothetical protein VLS28_01015 [Candidatus Sulfomarinibacteraceae bacterium]|nr:hypothetical protein [Candidatus Sulfomarinibacteraceae bacterium]
MTHLAWSDEIGKRVRTGDWTDQAVSTVTKIREALEEAGDTFGLRAGRRETSAQLVDYFMEEAKVVYVVYKVWTEGFLGWLRGQGVTDVDLTAELDRLARLMAWPDGTPLDPSVRWEALGVRAGRLANGIRSYDLSVADATAELEGVLEDWRRLHDRHADVMAGVLAYVARSFGENALDACYRSVLEPYIQERYMVFDVRLRPYADTLVRNLYISLEAMRAHLVGPGRRGNVGLEEFEDRWELSFDPCGSGGRQVRGDEIEGTGSRVLAPYEFGVTQEPHPWSWNETGVCYYCAHCNLTLSTLPAERWGHPVRTVEPPLWRGPDDPQTRKACKWTVWKTLEAIPEQEYERIGRTKPQLPAIQPGADARPIPDRPA